MEIRHHISDFVRRNEVTTVSVVETTFGRFEEMPDKHPEMLVRMSSMPSLSFGDWRKHDWDAATAPECDVARAHFVPAGIAEFDGEATNLSNCKDHVSTIAQTTKYHGLHEEGRQGTAGF